MPTRSSKKATRDAVTEQTAEPARSPNYYVPALEKGLDILECLAAQAVPLTQAQLARLLGRGPNELFRVLTTLERRGYVQRDPLSAAYSLTLRLYELSHTHSPMQELLRAASRPMRELTEQVRESCHLSVIHRGKLLVLAQEESAAKVRLSVEVGATFPLLHTVSGRVLLAHLEQQMLEENLELDADYASLSTEERAGLHERLRLIRSRGYDTAQSEVTDGVSDLAVLVGTPDSNINAALAIAALTRNRTTFVDDMLPALRHCADLIGRTVGIAV